MAERSTHRKNKAVCEVVEPRTLLSVTRPSYNTGTGFFVSGSGVYDANGEPFIIRGFNQNHWWGSPTENTAAIAQGARTGANAVRAVFFKDLGTPTASGSDTPAERKAVVEQYLANNIVPIVEDHAATENENNAINDPAALAKIVDNWLDPANLSWLKLYERQTILNITNEWGPAWASNNHVWRDSYITQVQRLRTAGVNNLIMIDAGGWGQDINTLKFDAASVLNADPQHNIVFSIHIYGAWRTEERSFDVGSGIFSVANEFSALRTAGLPFVLGEFAGESFDAAPYRTRRVLEIANQLGVGYMGWGWANVGETLSMIKDVPTTPNVDYQYNTNADLSAWGDAIINDPDYGIKATAKRATIFTTPEVPRLILRNTTIDVAETGRAVAKVHLSAQPTSAITVSLNKLSGDSDLSLTAPSTLTFTPENWNQDQSILVAAGADADVLVGTARFMVSAPGLRSVDFLAREIDANVPVGTFALTPTQDRDTQSDVAAGTNATVYASKWNYFYLQFDLSTVGGRAASAILRINKTAATSGLTVRAWSASTDAWTQATAPASLPPLTFPAISQALPNATGFFSIDITGLINQELRSDRTVTIVITTDSDNWTPFSTKEAAASLRPQLQINSVEAVPPEVLSASFDHASAVQTLSLDFSEDVSASLRNVDVVLESITNPTTVLQLNVVPNWDAQLKRATFTFATAQIPDGRYRARLVPEGVTDVVGNAMIVGTSLDFFSLTGDANHDAAVNFDDLLILSQNYGQTGRLFADGDLDHDGDVGFSDLLILAQHYGESLPLAGASSAANLTPLSVAASRRRRVDTLVV